DTSGRKKPSGKSGKGRRGKKKDAEPDAPQAEQPVETETADTSSDQESADDSDDGDDDGARRRRRRGRRGRGRGRGTDGEYDGEDGDDSDESDTSSDAGSDDGSDDSSDSDDTNDESADSGDEGGSGSRRRRRRRRRGGSDNSSEDRTEDDPPNTVTKVRQPRDRDTPDSSDDQVQSVRGSTRLEAKRQRRRDGRDAGRRRPPILSESEFLARRESVERTMVIRQLSDRNEIGVLEDDVLVEHFITGGQAGGNSMVGNIYLGRVQNVLPSMEAAFVDIGRGRNAVLYAGEVNWDAAGLNGKARRIEQALSSGDPVLVQVTKDPVGHKGARLTTQISLAGRFLVYVPSGSAAGISRKLPDNERKRLKDMLKEIVPSEAGVIIRTASEGVSHEALERDVRRLQAQWEVVKEKSEKTGPKAPKAPTLLYEEPDMLVKVVRDQFNEDFSKLIISGDDAWDTVSDYVEHVAPELGDRMHRHVGSSDVFTEHRIDEQLLKALDRKVWLPSGGTLVIDRTEAMTVVDVNTGKYTGSGGNLEETVTRNNLEAAEEVVRQLRLRDIGGIIVVDFIDMVLEANRDLVLRRLTECLARDRTRHQVAEVTSLGLVQMTRKRVGGGLLEHFSTPCETCRGRGVIVSAEGPGSEGNGHHHGGNGASHGQQNGNRGGNNNGGGSNGGSSSNGGGGGNNAGGDGGEGGSRRSRGRGGRRGGGQDKATTPEVDTSSAAAGVALVGAATLGAGTTGTGTTGAGSSGAGLSGAGSKDAGKDESAPAASSTVADAAPAPEPGPAAGDVPQMVHDPVSAVEPVTTSPDEERGAASAPVVEVQAAPAAEAGTAASVKAPAPAPAEEAPAPRRKRGRVSRSAGAPSTSAEPVVISTATDATATPSVESPAPVVPPVPPQPEPVAVATRPRRTRRAASRPAGPPVDAPAGAGAGTAADDGPPTSTDTEA
ncbi:Rne/Rng family ribonuclease, partial [Pseudonocardia sp. KRD291]|uniref:Rne/Rng family ribonuclease n=1 Tax=Pseudonocardia sp. KRD291 TaxID=2792007 RepID=UPI001C4A14B5